MKNKIFSGFWGPLHCQGMTMDTSHKYIYYSFTTILVKTDIDGNIIGSVKGIVGHLGCIDFNDDDNKVYASLEYKNDEIGRGILRKIGLDEKRDLNRFYIAIFDVDKIDRLDMDAEKDGIVKVAYLKEVVDDYLATITNNSKEYKHRYGCSGIDGLAIGPDFGSKSNKKYLHVSYGIYSDISRTDNDHQIILQYEIENLNNNSMPISQDNLHEIGPKNYRNKYFVYTGNTTYGIQNLEYDEYTNNYFAFVYEGVKKEFPNFKVFAFDTSIKPEYKELKGLNESGNLLTLKNIGNEVNGISGTYFDLGSMGVYSLSNGYFYFVDPIFDNPDNLSVNTVLYKLEITDKEWIFKEV